MAHTISELAGVHVACDATAVSLSVLSFVTGSWPVQSTVSKFVYELRKSCPYKFELSILKSRYVALLYRHLITVTLPGPSDPCKPCEALTRLSSCPTTASDLCLLE